MRAYAQQDAEVALALRLKKACKAAEIDMRKYDNTRENAGLSPERILARQLLKVSAK